VGGDALHACMFVRLQGMTSRGAVQVVASALKGRLQHWPQSLQLPAQQQLEPGYFDAPGASETARYVRANQILFGGVRSTGPTASPPAQGCCLCSITSQYTDMRLCGQPASQHSHGTASRQPTIQPSSWLSCSTTCRKAHYGHGTVSRVDQGSEMHANCVCHAGISGPSSRPPCAPR
jgi:hypothetical protein